VRWRQRIRAPRIARDEPRKRRRDLDGGRQNRELPRLRRHAMRAVPRKNDRALRPVRRIARLAPELLPDVGRLHPRHRHRDDGERDQPERLLEQSRYQFIEGSVRGELLGRWKR
jgi:hypothetical protein